MFPIEMYQTAQLNCDHNKRWNTFSNGQTRAGFYILFWGGGGGGSFITYAHDISIGRY